jgi:HlyD family secretion protein
VAAGVPILNTADLNRPWVNIYIEEEDMVKVRLGQQAKVSADGLDTPVTGKVTYIAAEAEFTPKFIQTKNERTNLVFRTEVSIDNKDLKLHPGLPADVELLP